MKAATQKQLETLGNWSISVASYHELNNLIQLFTNQLNELQSLKKVVVCLGADIDCFDKEIKLLENRINSTTEKKVIIYNLLHS